MPVDFAHCTGARFDATPPQRPLARSSSLRGNGITDTTTEIEERNSYSLFIGASPQTHRMIARVVLLAEGDLPVLISGEPGSENEVIARLLHQLSARSDSAFVAVDCASSRRELLSQILFGQNGLQSSGSFPLKSGVPGSEGLSTLFLENLEEMPFGLQSQLANAMRIGRNLRDRGTGLVEVGIRIVASSGPSECITSGRRILPELAHHFDNREVRVPPLRDRKEELPLLARHYMHELSKESGILPKVLSPAMEHALQAYLWPGNLRELKQHLKDFLLNGAANLEAKPISLDQMSQVQLPGASTPEVARGKSAHQLSFGSEGCRSLRSIIRSAREEAERAAIALALEETRWNRKAAARMLKVSYRSILYKIAQYKMKAPTRLKASGAGRITHRASNSAQADTKAQ